jgi:hypothetical protein
MRVGTSVWYDMADKTRHDYRARVLPRWKARFVLNLKSTDDEGSGRKKINKKSRNKEQ